MKSSVARQAFLGVLGLAATSLFDACVSRGKSGALDEQRLTPGSQTLPQVVRFLAVGDINLGRSVGQKILEGDTLFPFALVADTLSHFDVVFGNLESNLSDQHGETQDPVHNMVFTGPPAGAWSLSRAEIRVVSTANNHALDYGVRAEKETMESLRAAGVSFAGTAEDSSKLDEPARITRNGIRLALFACTDIMNTSDTTWHRYVAWPDTERIFSGIRQIRDSVDFIIVSYHGGDEYGNKPSGRSRAFMRSAISAGADLVLGHHPHVPYGIERVNGRYIVQSLGNFVFSQPFQYWTQRSFAFEGHILKDSSGTKLSEFYCRPVRCGVQPWFLSPGPEADSIYERIHMYSMSELAEARR